MSDYQVEWNAHEADHKTGTSGASGASDEAVSGGAGRSIRDLPTETLVDIFVHLTPADLRDVSLVCRRWNAAALHRAVWTHAFHNRFQTGDTFASVTRLHNWLTEYFGRMARTRQWAKTKERSHVYLVEMRTDGHGFITADFAHDRLMMFSQLRRTLVLCALVLGRNQAFYPDNAEFLGALAQDASLTHLCVATNRGEVYAKNLVTATAVLSRLSVAELARGLAPVVLVRMRRTAPEVAVLDAAGRVRVLLLGGVLVRESVDAPADANLPAPLFMDTDFVHVWVVTTRTVRMLLYATLETESEVLHEMPLPSAVFDENSRQQTFFHVDPASRTLVVVHGAAVCTVSLDGHGSLSHVQLPARAVYSALQLLDELSLTVAGGDGRLLAVAMADGSVEVFNVRARTLRCQCHIPPFSDLRSPRGREHHTKVAVDGSVVVVAVVAGWTHVYDAHLGRYLRECLAVPRRFATDGYGGLPAVTNAVFLGPGAQVVVVSGSVVQHLSYGELRVSKKPSAPQGADTALRRARQHAIRAQMDDWDLAQHLELQNAARADRFNGTLFESEQDELRTAMALSASCNPTLWQELGDPALDPELDPELERALELLRRADTHEEVLLERALEMLREPDPTDEDEMLRRALELLLIDH